MPGTATVTEVSPGCFEVSITETATDSNDEVTIDGVPRVGAVVRQTSSLDSGTGTTVDPVLTRETGTYTGTPVVCEPPSAAAIVDRAGSAAYVAIDSDASGLGRLYHCARVDAGNDNEITTVYLIKAGW